MSDTKHGEKLEKLEKLEELEEEAVGGRNI